MEEIDLTGFLASADKAASSLRRGLERLSLQPKKDAGGDITIAKAPTINLKVTADHIKGDFLGRDFRDNGTNSLLFRAIIGASDILANVGRDYDLPGVNIRAYIPAQNMEMSSSTPEGPADTEPTFMAGYITLEKLFKLIENDPAIQNVAKEEVGLAGGAALPGARQIYTISRDEIRPFYNQLENADSRVIRSGIDLLRTIAIHELGHVFGLEHVDNNAPGYARNPMGLEWTLETTSGPQFTREQVMAILSYFNNRQ